VNGRRGEEEGLAVLIERSDGELETELASWTDSRGEEQAE
jgi:hypothetical protein